MIATGVLIRRLKRGMKKEPSIFPFVSGGQSLLSYSFALSLLTT